MSVVQSSRRAATDTAWSSCTAMVSVVGLAVGVLSVLLVFLTLVGHYRFAYYRQYARQVAQRQQRLLRADKLLDALAGTLRATANPDAAPATSLNPATDTMMLVFTDIQDSTTAAAEHPNAMAVVQEVHDRLMRQGIQRFAGYEIHTQGDAFEIAFASAVSAVQFCLWIQDALSSYDWSKEVLAVTQFTTVLDPETHDVIFRGPRVRCGAHAALPGMWRKATHGYTHHTVFGGEGVDLCAAVSDAGHGGQIVLTKDAADTLIPRIHKVDALLESIGTFRIEAEECGGDGSGGGITVELFDCQPISTPKRPRRVFSKNLRRITYVAPGRSLAVIPPPPALLTFGNENAESVFIVVVLAEAGTGECADLRNALSDVVAQQAQLAGGYLASPDATSSGGAVVIFRTDYGAAARFLAVLPVVLAWWEWPETARLAVVVEGEKAVPTVRVACAMHVSSDVYTHVLTPNEIGKMEIEKIKRLRREKGKAVPWRASSFVKRGATRVREMVERKGQEVVKLVGLGGHQKGVLGSTGEDASVWDTRDGSTVGLSSVDSSNRGGSKHGTYSATASPAMTHDVANSGSRGSSKQGDNTLDVLRGVSSRSEVRGLGLDQCRAVAASAHPGQCIMTRNAFAAVQAAARMPAGAFPVSLGAHLVTQEDLAAFLRNGTDPNRATELYELVSTFLGMRVSTPRLRTAKVLTPGFRQSPDPGFPVAVCFVVLSAPDRTSEATKHALEQAAACLRTCLAVYKGYECKSPEPNKFTCAFSAFADAVSFSGALHLRLLDVAWSDELLQKSGCAERVSDFRNPDGNPCAKPQVIWKGLHARCGVAFGNGCTRKPLNTGRADYFGAVPNLAARICAAAAYGQTLIEPTAGLAGVVWPEFDTSLESIYATPSKSEHQRSASMLHLSSHKNAASRGRLPRQQSASQVNAGSSSRTKHSKNGPGLVDAFSDGNSPRATPDRRRASLDFDAIGPAPDSILGTNLPDSTFGSLPDSILMNLPDSIRDANFDTIESCVSEPPEGLLDGCVSASFTPSAPAGDDASYDATSFSASSETGKNSELLPSNHAPDTFQMTLDLLGGFDLRGVSRRATLAQALPDVLRNARSMTFDPPSGRGVLPSECDVGFVSIACRDARLHYDRRGASAWGGVKSGKSWSGRSRRGSISSFASARQPNWFQSLFGKTKVDTAKRSLFDSDRPARAASREIKKSLRPRKKAAAFEHDGDVHAAAMRAMELGEAGGGTSTADTLSTTASSDTTLGTGRSGTTVLPETPKLLLKTTGGKHLTRFRHVGNKVVATNRLAGTALARNRRHGAIDDWGCSLDLDDMPTAESERSKDELKFSAIGSGRGAERLLGFAEERGGAV